MTLIAGTNSEVYEDAFHWVLKETVAPGPISNLPAGFPILVDDRTGIICEPVLLYFYEKFLQKNADGIVRKTLLAYGYDLKEWWQYLEVFSISWTSATTTDLLGFCRVMRSTVSPQTGKHYATATINRRKSTIEGFYNWAQSENLYTGSLPDGALLNANESINRLKKSAGEKQHISVMERSQARAILEAHGPLPSELLRPALQSTEHLILGNLQSESKENNATSGKRLAAEIALNTGLRISEVCNLTIGKFQNISRDIEDIRTYTVDILGKGRKHRGVAFPGWLIKEIQIYINGERKIIAEQMRGHLVDCLILNSASPGGRAGSPISVRTLQRSFSKSCLGSGHYEINKIQVDEEVGEEGQVVLKEKLVKQPSFVFHDLRHTFAVWTYYAKKLAGDSDPLMYIQQQLGHSSLETTTQIYLSSTKAFEASITDGYIQHLNA